MKVVYVSGPYRAPTIRGIVQNIRRAETLALEVWKSGAACVCPHLNTALLDGACPDEIWLKGDLELVRRSDALLMAPGWPESQGAMAERTLAEVLGKPVFLDIHDLRQWLKGGQCTTTPTT